MCALIEFIWRQANKVQVDLNMQNFFACANFTLWRDPMYLKHNANE